MDAAQEQVVAEVIAAVKAEITALTDDPSQIPEHLRERRPDAAQRILVGQTISFEGLAIGSIEEGGDGEPWLFLDLGWCRAAGLHFSILGDRALDHRTKIIER